MISVLDEKQKEEIKRMEDHFKRDATNTVWTQGYGKVSNTPTKIHCRNSSTNIKSRLKNTKRFSVILKE